MIPSFFRLPASLLPAFQVLAASGLFWVHPCLAADPIFKEPGIISISATAENLDFTLRPSANPMEIADLLPHQFLRDAGIASAAARLEPGKDHTSIARFDGPRDRLYDGFIVCGRDGKTSGDLRHVEALRGISKNTDPFREASSKKGLQVQMVDDAIALGIKHAARNLDLAAIIDPSENSESISWTMDGRTFHFRKAVVEAQDRDVKGLSDAGIQVTLILLNYKNKDGAITGIMKPAKGGPNSSSPIWGFNVEDAEGAAWYRASIEFLADRYSGSDRSHGRVVGYIIGNEVDSHFAWYDLGDADLNRLVENYERAVRIANLAIRKASATARVYLSLDRQWTAPIDPHPLRASSSRAVLEEFSKRARSEGDFDWNLAFHPYPADLRNPRTWLDKVGTDINTAIISPRNLEVLPAYFRLPEMLYHGKPRRIILSEQGFNTPEGEDGERVQAAGFCYTWVKLSRLEGIDAFILHRHVDHAKEDGLKLGLWTRKPDSIATPDRQKPFYEVFRASDTTDWQKAFEPYLQVIGIKDWADVK